MEIAVELFSIMMENLLGLLLALSLKACQILLWEYRHGQILLCHGTSIQTHLNGYGRRFRALPCLKIILFTSAVIKSGDTHFSIPPANIRYPGIRTFPFAPATSKISDSLISQSATSLKTRIWVSSYEIIKFAFISLILPKFL
ncbi:MAG: hypothetical protein COV46_08310 [Deltaproteobacteria bacterium CG11_big_fil_rev_8_21_14_0_20_49_13]|nr:MAG: hypothetical protein COV46_08310 [Deltaproteobacteria bacterium CG11_big_fil_rev_8_21_14_0_20_49_13]